MASGDPPIGPPPPGPQDIDDWHAQVTEEILEPEIPIIDAHHHFHDKRDPSRPPPKRPPQAAINMFGERNHNQKDFWQAQLQATKHNVVGTVFLEASVNYDTQAANKAFAPLGEVKTCQAVSDLTKNDRTHVCAGIIGHVDLDLGAKEVEPVLLEMMKYPNFRGIRHTNLGYWNPDGSEHKGLPKMGTFGLYKDPKFREGLAVLDRLGLVFETACCHPLIDEVAELARLFPKLTIVLNHIGMPLGVGPYEGKRMEVFTQEWKPAIARIAQCPNVVCKLGGIMPMNGFGFEKRAVPPTSLEVADLLGPYYRFCIEQFGASRCYFESNFHVDRASVSYDVLWNAFKRVTGGMSPEARSLLFAGTAARVYKIDLPPSAASKM